MKKLLFLTLLAINFYHASHAQTETCKQIINQGKQAYKDANYEQAIKNYELACSLIGKAYGKQHPEYATCLNNLALSYQDMDSYAKAEPLFLEALQIRERTLGKQHPD